VFVTPPLEEGKTYYYVLTAEVERDGQTFVLRRTVAVRPGEETKAEFDLSRFRLASK
jgi:uncharacterized protein (TIGR03000 family)